jgi:hypothetical protein
MGRKKSARRQARFTPAPAPPPLAETPAIPRAWLWLVLAFLLPNLGVLTSDFVYDDLPIIVENERLHSLAGLGEIWRAGYWPDRPGLTLYRPVTQTMWSVLWVAGHGSPLPFHLLNLVLGAAAVVLAWRLLRSLRVGEPVAFTAALLFAVLPVHTEVTAAVVGSADLLAATMGLGALLAYRHGRRGVALGLWTLAVFSKESAAALPALVAVMYVAERERRPPWRTLMGEAVAVAAVVAMALVARRLVGDGPSFIPPIDNPMALVAWPQRVLTALWLQLLYLARCLVPATLSADYSYQQIRLVMGLSDARAWAALVLASVAALAVRYHPPSRLPLALWAVPFLATANVLFPIGTMMAERLVYLPSLGLCLGVAMLVRRVRRPVALRVGLAAIVVSFGARTAVRNLDWKDADTFYPKLVETAPHSARAWYSLGVLHVSRLRDTEALPAFDRAIAIFPAYPEAFNNRGNVLVSLGRLEEAKESYRQALRFDPGHRGAAASLLALEQGIVFTPGRRKL